MHGFTYAFLFFVGQKASFHGWIVRLNRHLVLTWLRLSLALAIALVAASLALYFGGSITSEYSKLSIVGAFLFICCFGFHLLSFALFPA